MKHECSRSRPERRSGRLPRLRSSSGIREQWLQVADRVLPIGIRAELDSVGSREKGGEAEQRVGSEEAVLAGGWRVEQQVDEWVSAAKLRQGAGLAAAKDADLARARAGSTSLLPPGCRRCRPGAQQPSGDARIQRLVDGFERRGYRSKVTGVALVQTASAWAPVREPPEPMTRSGERPVTRMACRKGWMSASLPKRKSRPASPSLPHMVVPWPSRTPRLRFTHPKHDHE